MAKMTNRIINLNIDGAYMTGGVSLGASGSANSVVLRMTFDSAWDGMTKTVHWLDANGENPVDVVIGLDMLVKGTASTYDVPVPAAPMAVNGFATMTVRGVIPASGNASVAAKVITTKAVQLRVLDADMPGSVLQTIPTTDKEQLQSEIDSLQKVFTDSAAAAKTSETNAAASAGAAESSANSAASTVAGFDSHASAKQSEVDASAKAAADSAAAAKNSENASASSSGAAKASEAAADTSAKTAAAKAAEAESASAEAKTSEENAKTSETNASLSASAAASMASGASKSAEQAAASAGTASAAALEASNNASSALSSKEAAASSETNASSSAAAAKASADKAAEIVGGDFATKSELSAVSASAANDASTKASSALTSANSYTDTKVDGIDLSPYAKASDLASHTGDKTKHITAEERTAWNGKAPASHKHAKSDISDFPGSMTPTTHASTHKSGGTDPLTGADIGISNPNLLINSDFTNPINTLGKTTYTAAGLTPIVDSWFLGYSGATAVIGDSGMTVTPSGETEILQFVVNQKQLYGKTLTLSAINSSGLIRSATGKIPSEVATTGYIPTDLSISIDTGVYANVNFYNGAMRVSIPVTTSGAKSPFRLKLESGSVSTISYDRPVAPGLEMAQCMGSMGKISNIATVSYTGTGTFGSGSPTSVTFPFPIKVAWLFDSVGKLIAVPTNTVDVTKPAIALCDALTESYVKAAGWMENETMYSPQRSIDGYMKISADRKTISWYSQDPNNQYGYQFNESGKVYYVLGVG